jgi:hypothetical protein
MEQRENLIYSIDPMNQIVEFNYMGSPSFEEWVSVMYAVLADRSFQPGYGFLSMGRQGYRNRLDAVLLPDGPRVHRGIVSAGRRRDRVVQRASA